MNEESQANALPKGEESKEIPEPWMSDVKVHDTINEARRDDPDYYTELSLACAIRDKAQKVIDGFRSAGEHMVRVAEKMGQENATLKQRVKELEDKLYIARCLDSDDFDLDSFTRSDVEAFVTLINSVRKEPNSRLSGGIDPMPTA